MATAAAAMVVAAAAGAKKQVGNTDFDWRGGVLHHKLPCHVHSKIEPLTQNINHPKTERAPKSREEGGGDHGVPSRRVR